MVYVWNNQSVIRAKFASKKSRRPSVSFHFHFLSSEANFLPFLTKSWLRSANCIPVRKAFRVCRAGLVSDGSRQPYRSALQRSPGCIRHVYFSEEVDSIKHVRCLTLLFLSLSFVIKEMLESFSCRNVSRSTWNDDGMGFLALVKWR